MMTGYIQKEKQKLAIIIVCYNSIKYLKECLNSLINNSLPASLYEIIVVDNASTDGSSLIIKNDFPSVRLITNEKNLGFSAANNIGIRSTSSEYILLINSDCQVYKNSLENMLNFMDKNKTAGVQGPKILNLDGSIQYSCRRFPSFISGGIHTILTDISPNNPISRNYKLADIDRNSACEVDWVSGSCMMLRRDALDDTGLLDEKYFMYGEDTDLCYQMWKKGWKVFYNPHSSILHHIGGSSKNEKMLASVRLQKSVLYFFWKNYRKSKKILLLPFLIPLLGLRILLTFIKNLLK